MVFNHSSRLLNKKIIKQILIAIVITASLDIAAFSFLPYSILFPRSNNLINDSPEAIAVLFHGFDSKKTGIDHETKRRLNHAIDLYHRNDISFFIVSGGNRPDKKINGAVFMAEYAKIKGISAHKIIIENKSRDSGGNISGIKKYLEERGLKKIALVSSPYHLWRIKKINHDQLHNFDLIPYAPEQCRPRLDRLDTWKSAHYNVVALLVNSTLPRRIYSLLVEIIRNHTEF